MASSGPQHFSQLDQPDDGVVKAEPTDEEIRKGWNDLRSNIDVNPKEVESYFRTIIIPHFHPDKHRRENYELRPLSHKADLKAYTPTAGGLHVRKMENI